MMLYLNIYVKHKISMIRVRTLKYSLRGCVFALLAALPFLCMYLFSFIVHATATNGVFFSTNKCALYFKNAILCLFLKNVSPAKRVICFILNNSHLF